MTTTHRGTIIQLNTDIRNQRTEKYLEVLIEKFAKPNCRAIHSVSCGFQNILPVCAYYCVLGARPKCPGDTVAFERLEEFSQGGWAENLQFLKL